MISQNNQDNIVLEPKNTKLSDFLAGDYLCRSDIVLFHSRSGIFSKIIKWFTKSSFSHAALLFLVPRRDEGFEDSFIIESTIGGVDVTRLTQYASSGRYAIAVKRLNQEWFDEKMQKRVRGHMLSHIKAEYDYFTIGRIATSMIKRIFFGFKVRMQGLEETIKDMSAKESIVPGEFICSGFVQYGFYKTVNDAINQGKLNPKVLEDIKFKKNSNSEAKEEYKLDSDLLSTTPEDLAITNKLEWKYAILGNKVYSINSYEDFNKLIKLE